MSFVFPRKILQALNHWKSHPERKPLILRGARQVGKTTIIHWFARQFDQYIYVNLEDVEERRLCERDIPFSDFVDALFFLHKTPKNGGQTLIFFDEIQNSPRCIANLRFFAEQMSHLYVIASGSLLEPLIQKHISFPVGRVEFQYLYPLSFEEFLAASQKNDLLQQLQTIPPPAFLHSELMKQFHLYTLIGGMPEVIKRYLQTQDLLETHPVFEGLLTSYEDDIEKYARTSSMRRVLRHVIRSIFFEAGRRITFEGFGQSRYRSREIREALRILERAMLIRLIYPTTSNRLPLIPNEKRSPKLQVLDTGLVNFYVGLQETIFQTPSIDDVYEGKIAEHVVGQLLIALLGSPLRPLVFWTREKRQSSAEIDFLFPFKDLVIPLEVKSGATGKLRSLRVFMDEAPHPYAVRIYSGEFRVDTLQSFTQKRSFYLLNLPFYCVERLADYLTWFTKNYPQ